MNLKNCKQIIEYRRNIKIFSIKKIWEIFIKFILYLKKKMYVFAKKSYANNYDIIFKYF